MDFSSWAEISFLPFGSWRRSRAGDITGKGWSWKGWGVRLVDLTPFAWREGCLAGKRINSPGFAVPCCDAIPR
jgi:hypothetical protein